MIFARLTDNIKRNAVNSTLCVLCETTSCPLWLKNSRGIHNVNELLELCADGRVIRPAHCSDLKFLTVNEMLELCAYRRSYDPAHSHLLTSHFSLLTSHFSLLKRERPVLLPAALQLTHFRMKLLELQIQNYMWKTHIATFCNSHKDG